MVLSNHRYGLVVTATHSSAVIFTSVGVPPNFHQKLCPHQLIDFVD